MDERKNSRTINVDDFTIGDLVAIITHRALIEEVSFGEEAEYVYGIVTEDPRKGPNLPSLVPQVAIYVFKSRTVEFHWPSYLKIISPIYKEG